MWLAYVPEHECVCSMGRINHCFGLLIHLPTLLHNYTDLRIFWSVRRLAILPSNITAGFRIIDINPNKGDIIDQQQILISVTRDMLSTSTLLQNSFLD